MAEKIHVPDISGDDTRPAGLCWKQSPGMVRCTLPTHDASVKHSWEKP